MKRKVVIAILCSAMSFGIIVGCGSSNSTVNEENTKPAIVEEESESQTEISVTEDTEDMVLVTEEIDTEDTEVTETPESEETASTGIRPEVKEFLDSYESFMNEYCDFMEKYSDSDDTVSMLKDYTDYMAKYAEFTEKMDALDDSDFNTEEMSYYLDVQNRVSKKLLTVVGG